MDEKTKQISDLLCKKSANKQMTYKVTQSVFREIRNVMQELQNEILPCLHDDASMVEIKYYDKGDFEAHLKFSGDTIVVMMHTNIFDFDESHFIHKTKYVKDNPLNAFCGMIQVYNFLSDTLRYSRDQDAGYLVARIFVNREKHFFVEGKRPLSFLYGDFEQNELTNDIIRNIIQESMLFCLNFDLRVPPIENVSYITLEQKNLMSYSTGIPTNKRLGFQMSRDPESESETH